MNKIILLFCYLCCVKCEFIFEIKNFEDNITITEKYNYYDRFITNYLDYVDNSIDKEFIKSISIRSISIHIPSNIDNYQCEIHSGNITLKYLEYSNFLKNESVLNINDCFKYLDFVLMDLDNFYIIKFIERFNLFMYIEKDEKFNKINIEKIKKIKNEIKYNINNINNIISRIYYLMIWYIIYIFFKNIFVKNILIKNIV